MKTNSFILIALVLLCGAKAFAQEWEYSIPFQVSDVDWTRQYCAYEMSDGRIIVSTSFLYNDGSNHPFYPPHNALIALSPDGEELVRKDYLKPAYWGSSYNPYVFENKNGDVFMLGSYSPDHNYNYFNYFLNYENPPTDAILGLYKLDENLEIVESFEHSFPIDTAKGQDPQGFDLCENSGGIHVHSAILDEGFIVGAYTKNVSYDKDSIHGYDSLFLFRMNFEGELMANVGYELPYSGVPWQMVFWREQLVSTDDGYIYYNFMPNTPPSPDNHNKSRDYTGTVAYFDKDFNLLRTRKLVHPGGNYNNNGSVCYFDDVSIIRSSHNTTYLATRSSRYYNSSADDCFLYEFDDDIEGSQDIVPIIREIKRSTDDFDFVAECRAVDVRDDHSLFFCYSLKVGIWYNDSWIVIEQLDEDFNTLSTVYYSDGTDNIWCVAESITLAKDGGVFLTLESRKIGSILRATSTVKFPAEVFDGIEEAHENGLKVAIAYPNPGGSTLNIRTGLQKARVEVYDALGRKVHRQEITENITAIDAESWPSGVYVWKVYANGSEAESGKWVKE